MEDPKSTPLAVHCFCLCSGSVLLGDLLGVSRSSERDLLSVLSNYPRIFFCVFIVYRRIVKYSLSVVFCYMLMSVDCFGLVVSTCQVIGYRKTLWWHLHEVRRLSPQSSGGRVCLCAFFFYLVCLCSYVFPRPYAIYIFHTSKARYSLYVLKVPLNTKQTKQTNKIMLHYRVR